MIDILLYLDINDNLLEINKIGGKNTCKQHEGKRIGSQCTAKVTEYTEQIGTK